MGSGSWTRAAYATYCCSTGKTYNATTDCINENYTSTAQAFKSCKLNEALDPKNIIRECCDSKEHPESLPIILALDVTGSMGDTAIRIQKLLNPIMTKIYEEVKDAEIAIMAIGDLACDDAPIQMSQFESDIRIADNLDKIYFERGGGGNTWESYTAAWYMGLKHTKLDCWKRGRKGIIITMGDEKLNPYLPLDGYSCGLRAATGDSLQADVETKKLYKEAKEKFDMFHICVESGCYPDQRNNLKTFQDVMGEKRAIISSVDDIKDNIIKAIKYYAKKNTPSILVEDTSCDDATAKPEVDTPEEISW